MFSRILVPLDGSPRAERAIPVAARVARASGATLLLTQILSAPQELLPYFVPGWEPATLGVDLEQTANYLTLLSAQPALSDIPVETQAKTGLAPSMILAMARSENVELIVLTSHGHTGPMHWAVGGTTQKIVRLSDVPVLVLKDSGPLPPEPATDNPRPIRILVALDGSAAAEASVIPAAWLAATLATPTTGEIRLVHIINTANLAKGHLTRAREWAREYLGGWAERLPGELGKTRVGVSWAVAEATDVTTGLTRVAAGLETVEGGNAGGPSDLIAVTTHGHTGLQLTAMGAVAERLLHDTRLPILVARPPKAAE